jgi:hypothetical protein
MRTLRRIIVHHSAGPRTQTFAELRDYHRRPVAQGGRGFEDVAYHFVVDDEGVVYAGRPVHVVGAHALGANHDSIGVCGVGDNTRPGEEWTDAQRERIRDVVQALCLLYGITRVEGHRDATGGKTATLCPGLDVAEVLT